jgi:protein-S-isoprenylcysteine O-methyltransferase Ste14
VLVIALNRFAIIHEENYLEEKFGDDYLQYKEKVRRWI